MSPSGVNPTGDKNKSPHLVVVVLTITINRKVWARTEERAKKDALLLAVADSRGRYPDAAKIKAEATIA